MTGADIDYIKCQYREAADKKTIVEILAYQYDCYKSDMVELLIYLGFDLQPIKRQNKGTRFFSDEETDIIYSGIVNGLKNSEILKQLDVHGFKRSASALSERRQIMYQKHPELLQYKKPNRKWQPKELEWIDRHYGEEDTVHKLAVRFKKEMQSKRELPAIKAWIYSYAKKKRIEEAERMQNETD